MRRATVGGISLPAMKFRLALLAAGVLLFVAPPGTAFASFAGDGIETVNFGAIDSAGSVAVGPDGEIVTVGSTSNAMTSFDLAVARFDAVGNPDGTFSGDGRQITDLGGFDSGKGIVVQKDGKIVAVGSNAAGNGSIVVVRYTKAGELDPTFAGDGIQEVSFPGGASGDGVALGRKGTITVVGEARNNFAVARLSKKGELDRSFSKDGKTLTDMGGLDGAEDVAAQPDGRIVVAGTTCVGGGMCLKDRMAVARYKPNGGLDRSFSKDGRSVTNVQKAASAEAVALQRDGRIVLAGSANDDFASFAAVRLKADGSLDRKFGKKGKTVVSFGDSASARDVVVLRSGRIVMAGDTQSTPTVDSAVVALRPNGSLDGEFAGGGKATYDIGAGNGDTAAGIAVLSRKNFVVMGSFNPNSDIYVARFDNVGALAG